MGTRNAKRVKDITGMQQICIDLKPNRCDSDVYINQKIDVTNLMEYLSKKKEEFVPIEEGKVRNSGANFKLNLFSVKFGMTFYL